jgi:transposase
MKTTRIFKFKLDPTPLQSSLLNDSGQTSRFLWNKLVWETNRALDLIDKGFRGNVEKEYIKLLFNKNDVGQRITAINRIAAEENLSFDEAKKRMIQKRVESDTEIKHKKVKNVETRFIKTSNNTLAWKYALECVNANRHNLCKPSQKAIWTSIMSKWEDSCKRWINPSDKKAHKPKFKDKTQISAIQKQITKSDYFIGDKINLSWCGSKALSEVKIIKHRDIPNQAKIKQVAIVKNTKHEWFVCLFLEAEKEVFEKHYLKSGKSVGIDPGIKTAFTTSDGEFISPVLETKAKLKKIRKLQRKLDRQRRKNNPESYDDKGKIIRGKRPTNKSKSMVKTEKIISNVYEKTKNKRNEFYHLTAIKLLNQYDYIGIGNWKPVANACGGKGKSKKAINLKNSEHAISDFINKVKDKASISKNEKVVIDIKEYATTKTDHKTGEKLELTLADRVIYHKDGTTTDRDVNAAINIRSRMIDKMKEMEEMEKEKKLKEMKKVLTTA